MDSVLPISQLALNDSTPTLYNPAPAISEEAQDLILHHVELSAEPQCARWTRYAFAIVHRNWSLAGYRMLYRKPFDEGVHWKYWKGKRLISRVSDGTRGVGGRGERSRWNH